MPIQCRLVDLEELRSRGEQPKPGDMWYAPWYIKEDGSPSGLLSPEFVRDWLGKRPPLVVCLPNGEGLMVDSRYIKGGQVQDHGWTVTGEAPNITVSPSINAVGRYHGWLQNGVLGDDLDGRTYE